MNQPEERRVEWAPAIPLAFLTFLIGVFLWPVGAVLAVAALVTLVVRARRHAWTALTFGCLGVVLGAVLFTGFGASSLDFAIRAWTRRFDDWGTTRSELMTRLYAALTTAGIEIPFPQQDLHLRTVSEQVLHSLARSPSPQQDCTDGDT